MAAFDAAAAEFEASLAEPWNRLKYDLALDNLIGHLPPATPGGRCVLDAGGGTGELGLRLLARGACRDLTLLDPAPAMLAIAREKAARLGVAGRCRFVQAPLEGRAAALGAQRFDIALCHNVLEYVADPAAVARALAGVLRPGGVLSLLAMNADALPLVSLLLHGDPAGALAHLGRDEHRNRFGIVARTFPPAALRALTEGAGLRVVAWYGVRMFYDYVADPRKGEPAFYDAVAALERAVRATDPYRGIGRDTQVLARAD
ncbi:MAG TPA: methyltransferase [Thermomicrobiales bacterium]|nr:methyltransferase [Thermomicrobiales bacterium]